MDEDTSIEYRMCFNKKQYTTEMAAHAEIGRQQYKFNYFMRVYKCPICRNFHITHCDMNKRQIRKLQLMSA